MPFRAKQSRPWRVALVAAVLAATTLAIGALSRPAAAQYMYDYGYGYPGPAYSYPPQSYPAYPSHPPYGQQIIERHSARFSPRPHYTPLHA
jgi:hypothetical protein